MSDVINVRLADQHDAHAIATIHVVSWQTIYRGIIPDKILDTLSIKEREERWSKFISNNVKILVIERNSIIVGFASICPSRDPDTNADLCGEISAIYLHPDVWHQGLGKKLCEEALLELHKLEFSEVIVWVLQNNKQAIDFYEKMGFSSTTKHKVINFGDGIDLYEAQYKIMFSNIVQTPFSVGIKIRMLNAQKDWKVWKNLRLECLKNSSYAFVSSFEEIENQSDKFFQKKLQESKIYGAFYDSQLVSIIGFNRDFRSKEKHRGHISGMYTKQEFSRKGIGSKLLEAVLTEASEVVSQVHLSCVVNNYAAIHLYEKYGFKTYGIDPRAIKIEDKFYDMNLMCLIFK